MAYTNNYVVGKGRLFFARFMDNTRLAPPGAGMVYFGNTPTLEVSRSATALDHYDSDAGVKVKDDSMDIETNINGKFTCDNINSNNLALLFGAVATTVQQAVSQAAITETFTGAFPDNYYQIGSTANNPGGLKGVSGFTATAGAGAGTALVSGTDYTFDTDTGLFYPIPGGAVPLIGEDIHVSYSTVAMEQEQVVDAGVAIFGAMKFISSNPKGRQRDYYWPYVKLSADTPLALKGDTWQTAGWSFEALKRDDNTQRVYVTAR